MAVNPPKTVDIPMSTLDAEDDSDSELDEPQAAPVVEEHVDPVSQL